MKRKIMSMRSGKGYLQTGNYEDAFRMGVATGSASAFSERLATVGEVNMLIDKVVITR